MLSKKYVAIILLTILLSLNACTGILKHNTGVWFYTFTKGALSSEYSLTPASFLCLDPDKTYTMDFGKFEYGKWMRNGDTLILNTVTGNTEVFVINNKGKDMELSPEPGVLCDFELQPYSFDKNVPAPFSLQDNQWRIKATRKETPAAIRARLVNHCRFWKDYFTWALNNNIASVDVRSIPTPVKIYGNGFALKNMEDLPAGWKNYFFDSADCEAANNMIAYVFAHNDIAWAHTDNKYKMFTGAFEQLQQMLSH